MAVKKMLAAAIASALLASPVVASVGDASALALQPAAETVSEGNQLLGGEGSIGALILGGVILAGFILAIIDVADDDDSQFPVSP